MRSVGQALAASSRRRPGHRPEWSRPLSEIERIGDAALDLISRDADLREQLLALAARQPDCAFALGRHLRSHASSHATCSAWLDDLISLGWDAGCPDLAALAGEADRARDPDYRIGSVRIRSLRLESHALGRTGLDHPARLILARRWRRSAADTWPAIEQRWADLVDEWTADRFPDRRSPEYPAFREWAGVPRIRRMLREPPGERRDEAIEAWMRGGVGGDVARSLRRGVAALDRIVRAELGRPGL